MGEELEIIDDLELCRKMGWTLTDLGEQPFFSVQVARKWLDTQAAGEKLRVEKQKKEQARNARRKRRRGR